MTKIFIDGSAGTTGLRIKERLSARDDIELIVLDEAHRKDTESRKKAIHESDITFLCLPDAAAIEAVELAEGSDTVIIDTSTAHRTANGWTYGFPELTGYENIKNSKKIANPGCHASGFVALVKPLTEAGIISSDAMLSCFSITGYSGGGKSMIAEYESEDRDSLLGAPRQYGLTQQHKHLKEMAAICGLENSPLFCPIVADFYSGMEVTVTLFASQINGSAEDIRNVYRKYYNGGLVSFNENPAEGAFMSASAYSGRDDMEISVCGNDERITLIARFDNLGKGASGSAIQNMNILLGADEATGLVKGE